jgi:hypothetical protein
LEMLSGPYEIRAPSSSMRLSVLFREESTMTPLCPGVAPVFRCFSGAPDGRRLVVPIKSVIKSKSRVGGLAAREPGHLGVTVSL